MEAAFQVIRYFCDIRHIDVFSLVVVVLGELEVHLLGEEEF